MNRKILFWVSGLLLFGGSAVARDMGQTSSPLPSTFAVQDYGLRFDGSEHDKMMLNALFSTQSSGSVLVFPAATGEGSLPSYYTPDGTQNKTSLIVNLDSRLKNQSALDSIDGYPKIQFDENGVLSYKKSVTNNTKARVPNIWLEYFNNYQSPPNERPDHINLNLIGHSGISLGYQPNNPHASGDLINLNNVVQSIGRVGYGAFDINNYNYMYRYGTNWVWDSVQQLDEMGNTPIHSTDRAFNDASDTHEWVQEWDISGFGPEEPCSYYNPACGYRTGFLFNSWVTGGGNGVQWKKNKHYNLGEAINVDISGKIYSFIVTKAGESGGMEPSWDLHNEVIGCDPHYPNSNTDHAQLVDIQGNVKQTCEEYKKRHDRPLKDGSVEWSFNTPMNFEVANFIRLSQFPKQDIKYGTFLSSDAVFYNAVMDFSEAKFLSILPHHVVLRTQPDTYIDFTGKSTKETQNLHIFGYNSKEKTLEYKIENKSTLKIKDLGGIVLTKKEKNTIKQEKNPEEGEVIYDTTDSVPVIFSKGEWRKINLGASL